MTHDRDNCEIDKCTCGGPMFKGFGTLSPGLMQAQSSFIDAMAKQIADQRYLAAFPPMKINPNKFGGLTGISGV